MSLTAPLYFRDLIQLFGGLREVNNIMKWLNYYGFKWFRELREAGVSRSRSYLVYVLERAVEMRGWAMWRSLLKGPRTPSTTGPRRGGVV